MNYSKILNDVKNDSTYKKNILYGEPRNEHPEGTILAHINELTGNLDKIKCYITKKEYDELASLIHVHDICKPDIAQNSSLRKQTNHQTLAKDFNNLTWFYNEILNLAWKVEICKEIFYAIGLEAR